MKKVKLRAKRWKEAQRFASLYWRPPGQMRMVNMIKAVRSCGGGDGPHDEPNADADVWLRLGHCSISVPT